MSPLSYIQYSISSTSRVYHNKDDSVVRRASTSETVRFIPQPLRVTTPRPVTVPSTGFQVATRRRLKSPHFERLVTSLTHPIQGSSFPCRLREDRLHTRDCEMALSTSRTSATNTVQIMTGNISLLRLNQLRVSARLLSSTITVWRRRKLQPHCIYVNLGR